MRSDPACEHRLRFKHWFFTLIVPYFMGACPCALPLYPLHFHAPTLIIDFPELKQFPISR